MQFKAGSPEIEPHELVRYLLREAAQLERDAVNPADLLGLLKLQHLVLNFDVDLPLDQVKPAQKPRALLSFTDRLIAVHAEQNERRMRFSALHEIGHYVLPNHQRMLFLCSKQDLTLSTDVLLEKEASDFAADLLFLGDRFTIEANSRKISAATVKELADKYLASYEATARRLVEKNLRPCMLVVFEKDASETSLDTSQPPIWRVRYYVASAPFRVNYFDRITGVLPGEVAAEVTAWTDIAASRVCDAAITASDGRTFRMIAEFFTNQFNVFCLLTPT